MGNKTSQTVKTFTEVMNTNTTNILNKQAQNVSSDQSTVNNIELDMSNSTFDGCNLSASNKITANQTVKAIANFKSASEINDVIKQAMDKSLESSQKQVNDMLNTAFGNSVTKDTESTTKIMNDIKANITNDSAQNILAKSQALNSGKYPMIGVKCKNSTFTFSNDAIVTQTVDAMVASVMDAIKKTMTDQGLTEKIKDIQDVENKGLSDVIKSLGDLITAFQGPLIIIGIVIVAFLLLGGTSLFKGGSGGGGRSGKKPSKTKVIIGVILILILIGAIGYIIYKKKQEGYVYEWYYASPEMVNTTVVDCVKTPEKCIF